MQYIQKNPEPPELTQWRETQLDLGINFTYKYDFQNPEKAITRQSLLDEQGWICCYCCKRISKETSHIEHFDPQSGSDPILTVTYSNMLASCGPLEREPADKTKSVKWPKHCGHQRGREHEHEDEDGHEKIPENAALPIGPHLDPDCESYFTYTSNGEIKAAEGHPRSEDATTVIKILSLNDPEVVEGRKRVLQALQGLTPADAQILWERSQKKDSNGQFRTFCPVALDYLRKYFHLP